MPITHHISGGLMLKLYQAEWCPFCARVRSRMTDLLITYININVPRMKADRTDLPRSRARQEFLRL